MIVWFARTAAWHRRSRSTCSSARRCRPACWVRDDGRLLLAQVGHQPLGGGVGVEGLDGDAIGRDGRRLAERAAEFDGRLVELGAEHRSVLPSAAAAAGAAVGSEVDPDLGGDDRRRLATDGLERCGGRDVGRDRRDGEHGLLEALQLRALRFVKDPHRDLRPELRLASPERLDRRVCLDVHGERVLRRQEGAELGAGAEDRPKRPRR